LQPIGRRKEPGDSPAGFLLDSGAPVQVGWEHGGKGAWGLPRRSTMPRCGKEKGKEKRAA
jgi:hypothetical protein